MSINSLIDFRHTQKTNLSCERKRNDDINTQKKHVIISIHMNLNGRKEYISMKFSYKQKRKIIEEAQKLYRNCFDERILADPFAGEIDIVTFKEACFDMACLVRYLAKDIYDIPDKENIIYGCEFIYDNCKNSHYFNIICGKIVDSTIMQFKNFSPYDNHDDCYTNLYIEEYSEDTIKNEIQLYEIEKYHH